MDDVRQAGGGRELAVAHGADTTTRLLDRLTVLAAAGAGLAATPSRRTAPEFVARAAAEIAALGGWFWRGDGDNPYFALLGGSDALIVSADSVNMASEACAAGKPVFIADVDGVSTKHRRFHEALAAAGSARPLPAHPQIESMLPWTPKPLGDTELVAKKVSELLDQKLRAGDRPARMR